MFFKPCFYCCFVLHSTGRVAVKHEQDTVGERMKQKAEKVIWSQLGQMIFHPLPLPWPFPRPCNFTFKTSA